MAGSIAIVAPVATQHQHWGPGSRQTVGNANLTTHAGFVLESMKEVEM
ncbi:uncharacterized protein METZ01_LOCUS367134 [marine metagenome]|uniref:Uncharacterized protein n=1 Tax=marine metagenome TaxID=408172 RepID=A0A382SWF1_9ZZZZ